MLSNLLFYRFLLFNLLVFLGIGAVAQQGWITAFVENDPSYISLAIIAVFLLTEIYQGMKSWTISKRINALKFAVKNKDMLHNEYPSFYGKSIAKLKILARKDEEKIKWMGRIAKWLVVMGLIGTVIGFIIALSGIPSGLLSGEEGVEGIQQGVGLLIVGMYVALYTTLAGSVVGLIVEINAAMIKTALSNYWNDIMVELGS